MRGRKKGTEAKHKLISEMLRAQPNVSNKDIQQALLDKFKSGVSPPTIAALRRGRDAPGRKLTDAQVAMLTGARDKLPPNVAKVAARLRRLLDIHKVEFITVYRDKPTVKFARYQESEASL
jgi:hypothetical protein